MSVIHQKTDRMRLVYILLAGAGVGLIVGGISLDPHRKPEFATHSVQYSSPFSYSPYLANAPMAFNSQPAYSTGFALAGPSGTASGTASIGAMTPGGALTQPPVQVNAYDSRVQDQILAHHAEETRIERQTRGLTAGLKGGGAALFATGILGLIVSLFGSIENWFVKRKSPAAPQETSP